MTNNGWGVEKDEEKKTAKRVMIIYKSNKMNRNICHKREISLDRINIICKGIDT